MEAVKARKLTKIYNGIKAVDSIDFVIHQGESFGFLGPNGAGKTTVVKMMYCFSPVTSGELKVLDMEVSKYPAQIKNFLGVVSQDNNLDPELSVKDNLVLFASYFNLPRKTALKRAQELLEFMGIAEKSHVPVENLSGGMKRRLVIARSLINYPKILVLDEPTTGLDPHARHLVWDQLRLLKEKGLTIILTTHYLEEASVLCDRLVIMDRGEILEEGNPRDLVLKHIGREVVEVGLPPETSINPKNLQDRLGNCCQGFRREGNSLYLFTNFGQELIENLTLLNIPFSYQLLRPATLEDVFLKLTGRTINGQLE
ncbi:MAG: ABC transporter ATP-binding protein [Candidatus Syntrophonatronum acetioxidans]|uniref:ABC transporter ATP-binding protein n=1 Tax=Candidatus Syntrophonatronum acetioxidans TaxID=1795816 RepID=A0A424YFG6_9FIRM|nr:MAG: ABC transporter ATP-binding protein [Candidatus Syntrophonatronum acetioxidans]